MTAPWFAILNPQAGGGRQPKRLERLLQQLRQRGIAVHAHATERPGHATELARSALQRGETQLLVLGGDGTCFEVVNGIMQAQAATASPAPPPTLAIVPLGTGNSLLRDFQVQDAESALDLLQHGRPQPCDLLRLEHAQGTLYSINLVSIGFSAAVGALTNARFKRFGAAGYVLALLASLARLRAETLRLRSWRPGSSSGTLPSVESRPATLVAFCNSRYTGGRMMMAPHADLADGEFDVVHVGEVDRRTLLQVFPRIYRGSHVEASFVATWRAVKVELIDALPRDVMIDGEVLHLALRSLEVVPAALRIMGPAVISP